MPAPALRILRKLRTLNGREWKDLLAAQFALLKTLWRVRSVPVGTLVVREATTSAPPSGDPERARAIALAVSRAADHGVFHPYCLVRAMALQELLAANGISGSAVRVGVRRENGQFSAHAWIVWRDEILGDRPENVARFMEVDDLRIVNNQ